MQSSEFTTSIKIHNQLAIYPWPVKCILLHSCEQLKDDDIVAAQFSSVATHMHIRSMGINFHEIALPREKAKISTPRKKPAIQ